MDEERATPDWAHSFGGVVDAYDRARPTYPREAAQWIVGQEAATVLELGAGTGKLTQQLVDLGHGVLATDPDQAMLDRLERNLPQISTLTASAEELPVGDHGFDSVVAAQAFHWFDLDLALPEIARALKRGGRLGLIWNYRDESIPWVRRLGKVIGTQEQLADPSQAIKDSNLFGEVEDATFTHWQQVDRKSIQDLVLSRSNVAVLDEEERAAKLAEVVELYDGYGRGMDGMQLPYIARCFRATVVDRAADEPEDDDAETRGAGEGPGRSDGTHTDTLLIDFR
ncbi:MAG: class I SAM-dependent methyltransferase [Nocardioides sp.]